MAMGINVTIEEKDDIKLVYLNGRLDASSTPALETKLEKLLSVATKVVINFSGVDYLSSAGLRFLLSSTKKMQAKEGKLVFCGIDNDVMEIIKMAGFETILPLFPTEKEAIQFLKQG